MSALSSITAKRNIDPSLPRYDSLVHMVRAAVELEPDITAVVYEDRQITYREFGRAVNGLAAQLKPLDLRGRPVILVMPNSIEMDIALMGVMSIGAQVAPVNPFFKVRELEIVLANIDAAAVITDRSVREKATEVAETLGIRHVLVFEPGGLEISRWVGDESLDRTPDSLPSADDSRQRFGSVPERGSDVSYLGSDIRDVGSDLFSEHLGHDAEIRTRKSCPRSR